MKRIFITLAATLLLTVSLRAQENDFNGWGLRASLDVNMPGKWHLTDGESVKMFKNGLGVTVGGVYNKPFAGNFYVEPGLSLFYDTYQYDNLTILESDQGPAVSDPTVKKFGLRVPVMVGYRFFVSDNFNFTLYTGPELSCGLVGRLSVKGDIDLDRLMDTDYYHNGYRRVDCAWKVGAGFPMGRWLIAIEGAFGLTDLHKNDISFKENRLSLTLGYDF